MRGSFLSASGRGSWSLSFQNVGRQHAVYRDFHKAISTRITNPVATISNVQAGIEMGSGRTRKGRNPDAVKGRAPIRPRAQGASSVQGQTAINDASCRQLLRQKNRRSHSRAGKHASGRCASLQPKRQWRRGAADRRCPRTAARRPLMSAVWGEGWPCSGRPPPQKKKVRRVLADGPSFQSRSRAGFMWLGCGDKHAGGCATVGHRATLGEEIMEWLSRKTSIAGTEIPNWILVVVAIVVILVLYRLIA